MHPLVANTFTYVICLGQHGYGPMEPLLVIITCADDNIMPNFAWIEDIWVYGKLVCTCYYSEHCLTQLYFIDTNRYIYM